MAANQFSISPVTVNQQTYPYGHDIRYNFSLFNAAGMQEWTLAQDYLTPCETSPTSWKLQMTLERDSNHLLVSGSAKLRRNDSINVAVRVYLVVKIRHPRFLDYMPIPMVDQIVLPGDEIRVNMCNIVPNTYNYTLREELSVFVYIYVKNCHQAIRKTLGAPDLGTKIEKKRYCSKM